MNLGPICSWTSNCGPEKCRFRSPHLPRHGWKAAGVGLPERLARRPKAHHVWRKKDSVGYDFKTPESLGNRGHPFLSCTICQVWKGSLWRESMGLLSTFWCDNTDSSSLFWTKARVLDRLWCGGPNREQVNKQASSVSLGNGRTQDVTTFNLNTTTPPRRKKHLFEVEQNISSWLSWGQKSKVELGSWYIWRMWHCSHSQLETHEAR